MEMAVGIGKRASRALVAVLIAVLIAVVAVGGLALVVGQDAGAAKKKEAKVSDGTMTWSVSNYVLTANPATLSVAEVHNAETPATFADGAGWTFTDGAGTYDAKTGAMTVAYPGALEFGNTSRGNYAFKFANPTFVLDATGSGTLTADVSVRPAGATAYNAASKIIVVNVTGATPTKSKNHVEVTAAPSAFSDPLFAATADLASHFRASGSSNDPNKPPAPIKVAFDYKVKK
jgi:Htaa